MQPELGPVIDDEIDTCVLAKTDMQGFLQIVFSFPDFPTNRQMSVDFTLKNMEDCSALAWTWFVRSECTHNQLRECSIALAGRDGKFTSCLVTCTCAPSCDNIHVKYNAVPWLHQDEVALCEVELEYTTINPPLVNNNQIWII